MRAEEIIQRPLVTEKSTLAREERNEVAFAVDPRASKHDVRRAIEALFSVRVEDVRTMRMPRKMRRIGRHQGARPQWKKAIVRLAEGQSIEFFEGV
ncbi:MAG TPA: 50S ribosomal protein L23 [Myxococcota bacterium]|nr:50S ribosomal protein L23 [Myxococcota bacterium]